MSNRRDFIKKAALGAAAVSSIGFNGFAKEKENEKEGALEFPSKKLKNRL